MSFYNTQNERNFRVADPILRLNNKVQLNSIVNIPYISTSSASFIIPAAVTIGGAYVQLNGDLSTYKFDTASNILAAIRSQVASVSGTSGTEQASQ